ncbi:MAG: SDR family NAD(P)-dependent oxidoreductase, partial [Mesorhizobium sp.]
VVGEIEAAGGRAIAIKADNRDATAIQEAVSEAVKTFGRLDILVNSAGIWRVAPIDELPLADFDETMEVNVRAPFVASKAAAVHMGEGGT